MQGIAASNFYTESIDKLLNGVDFTGTSRLPDLTLLETIDPTVYFNRGRD